MESLFAWISRIPALGFGGLEVSCVCLELQQFDDNFADVLANLGEVLLDEDNLAFTGASVLASRVSVAALYDFHSEERGWPALERLR